MGWHVNDMYKKQATHDFRVCKTNTVECVQHDCTRMRAQLQFYAQFSAHVAPKLKPKNYF